MRGASKKLRQQFAVLRDVLAILGYDTVFCLCKLDDELRNPGNSSAEIAELNFWLKASIRSFLAQVEGLTYAMRSVVVQAAEGGHIALEPKDLARLQERKYDMATGKMGPFFRGRFDENFKNAFRYLPRVFGCDWSLQLQGEGWEKFRKIVAARDDFTHPKKKAQLFRGVVGEDLREAVAWFDNNFSTLLQEIGRRLGKEIDTQSSKAMELSESAKSKLALIMPPNGVNDASVLSLETEFMALLKGDERAAYRVFTAGTSLQSGRLSIGEMSQLGARLYARTLFTEIEAFGYVAQRVLVDSVGKGEISLADDERELLSTKELTVKIANYAELFSHKFGHGRVIDRAGRSWLAFSQFAEFRDRITHPKRPEDLKYDIETLEVMIDAMDWYYQFLDTLELSEKYVNLGQQN